jgi:hypothetical protein
MEEKVRETGSIFAHFLEVLQILLYFLITAMRSFWKVYAQFAAKGAFSHQFSPICLLCHGNKL